jgi:hypothetical protein
MGAVQSCVDAQGGILPLVQRAETLILQIVEAPLVGVRRIPGHPQGVTLQEDLDR